MESINAHHGGRGYDIVQLMEAHNAPPLKGGSVKLYRHGRSVDGNASFSVKGWRRKRRDEEQEEEEEEEEEG